MKRASRPSLRSYRRKPAPEPKKLPNYDTKKKVDLHKLVEQVELNTLLQQSQQMKIEELQ